VWLKIWIKRFGLRLNWVGVGVLRKLWLYNWLQIWLWLKFFTKTIMMFCSNFVV
jgi:hypothetical protein